MALSMARPHPAWAGAVPSAGICPSPGRSEWLQEPGPVGAVAQHGGGTRVRACWGGLGLVPVWGLDSCESTLRRAHHWQRSDTDSLFIPPPSPSAWLSVWTIRKRQFNAEGINCICQMGWKSPQAVPPSA